jgi:hypothetical protein
MKSMLPVPKYDGPTGGATLNDSSGSAVFNPEWIPYELDLFYRGEDSFLPTGKTFETLTAEESKQLRNQYRFSPLRPGIYQAISGITDRLGHLG